MKTLPLVLTVVLPAAVALAAQEPDGGAPSAARDVLKKADAATRAVHAVTYDVRFEPDEAGAAMLPVVKGTYTLAEGEGSAEERSRAEIEVKRPGSDAVERFTVISDGKVVGVIDHQTKTVRQGADPAALGPAIDYAEAGLMIEFVHPTPFSDELAGKAELKGTVDVAGEECDEVHVVYDTAGAPEATWCFSKKDHLPRRRIDHRLMPNGKTAAWRKTISRLVVDPPLDGTAFAIDLPAGYTRGGE